MSDNTSIAAMNWLSGGNWDNGTTSASRTSWTAGDTATFGGAPAGTQTVTLGGGISVGALTVGNGYRISITGTTYNQLGNPSGDITLAAGATLSADAAGNNAHNIGTLNLNGGTLTSINGPAGTANDGGFGNWVLNAAGGGVFVGGSSVSTISCSTIDVGTRTFTVNDATGTAATDLLVSGRIFKGALTKAGAGTMEITGANTYTGATTILAGGGTLLVSGATGALGSGAISVGAGGTLAFNTSGNRTLAASISGAGAVTRQTTSGGRYYLSGNNSGFTGVFTQVSGGTGDLRFDSASAGSAAAQWVMNGPWMVFLLGTNTLHLGALSGSANTWNDSTSGTTTLSVGALGLDTSFSGNIGQGGGGLTALTKTGAGRLTLTGVSVYSGATLVEGGTLALGAGARSTTPPASRSAAERCSM
ncbi:MAG: autotransporter-associated beta strand repeat-containing protein [Kiritimatiellia bacterium]